MRSCSSFEVAGRPGLLATSRPEEVIDALPPFDSIRPLRTSDAAGPAKPPLFGLEYPAKAASCVFDGASTPTASRLARASSTFCSEVERPSLGGGNATGFALTTGSFAFATGGATKPEGLVLDCSTCGGRLPSNLSTSDRRAARISPFVFFASCSSASRRAACSAAGFSRSISARNSAISRMPTPPGTCFLPFRAPRCV